MQKRCNLETVEWKAENLFFLSQVDEIGITHSDNESELFRYANQYVHEGKPPITDTVDRWGRNYTDKLFTLLCCVVHSFVVIKQEPMVTFKYLSCKKINNQYIVHLELSNETLEMELNEMATLFEERLKST
jgi:hypothetical protein